MQCHQPGDGDRGGIGGACEEVVRYIAPHHKNDRRGSNLVISYDLPPGPLTKLLLIHIREGHGVLSRFHRHAQPHLFMSSSGLAFTDALFASWWATFYSNHQGPEPYFPPSKGRTLFVEHFIASTGHQPQESWEGAAMAMGNSVKQWREFYAPRMKHRLAQQAVHKHKEWREGMMAGASAHASMPSLASTFVTDDVADASATQPTPPPHTPPCPPQHVKREAGARVKMEPVTQQAHVVVEEEPSTQQHVAASPGQPSDRKRVKVEHEAAPSAPTHINPSEPASDAHPPLKKIKVESKIAGLGLATGMHATTMQLEEALHYGGDGHECGTTTSSSDWDCGEEPMEQQVEDQEGWNQQLQQQPPASDGARRPHWEATDACAHHDSGCILGDGDDDVVITRCVQPRCRDACDAIDLTMLSSSDEDDEF